MARFIADRDPTLPLIMLTTNQAVLHEVERTAHGKLFVTGLLKPFDLHALLTSAAQYIRPSQARFVAPWPVHAMPL